MASLAKLKDRARKYEQKEDWPAAIQAYQQVLEQEEKADEIELELGLYNRIGDLYLRLGQTDEAVAYYETAADKYAESGFFNNAIALCNKALRHRPNRPEIYLKLSGLCAEQGFHTDARRWILEYASRQIRTGRVEDALTALHNFAELSNDPEVRQILAQHLASHDRPEEAVDQLRKAHRLHSSTGATQAAAAVAERAREIDPSVDLAAEEPTPSDIGPSTLPELGTEDEPAGAEGAGAAAGLEGLETTAADVEAREEEEEEPESISGLEVSRSAPAPEPTSDRETDALGGLETFDTDAGEVEDVEEEVEEVEEEVEPLPMLETPEGVEEPAEMEPAEMEPAAAADREEEAELEAAVEAEMEAEAAADAAAPVEDEAVVEEEDEELEPLGPLDLGGVSGFGMTEADAGELPDEVAAEAMDLDLGSLSLGGDESGPSLEDLDVEAVLQRGREMVSRGLLAEALQELQLLSASDAGPAVFRDALDIVNEVLRHDANDLAALQRRVEYAARTDDRELLVEAHVDMADALARMGAEAKAVAMYERVLALDPRHPEALEALGETEPRNHDPVNLDSVLREMGVEDAEGAEGAEGAEESDPEFAAMLTKFRSEVSERVAPEEAADHYDLGLAFKEMGLIDEAIAEFQTALSGGTERLKVYEELGQCFIQKNQLNVALKVLNRALQVPHADDAELLGVYYHLGQVHEELGQRAEAREAYEKVLAIDPSFEDVPDRVARL